MQNGIAKHRINILVVTILYNEFRVNEIANAVEGKGVQSHFIIYELAVAKTTICTSCRCESFSIVNNQCSSQNAGGNCLQSWVYQIKKSKLEIWH